MSAVYRVHISTQHLVARHATYDDGVAVLGSVSQLAAEASLACSVLRGHVLERVEKGHAGCSRSISYCFTLAMEDDDNSRKPERHQGGQRSICA